MNRLTGLRIVFSGILVSGCLWGDRGSLKAQERRPEIPRQRLNVKATVKGLPSGLLHVVTADGEQWLVRPPENPQDISYEGSAEVSWLRPRMLVQFRGTFDSKGNSLEPVAHLTVFTLREGFQIGIFPDSRPAAGGELFSDEGSEQDKATKPKGMPFLVAGQLVNLKGRKLSVTVGNRSVTVDLANETKVSVNVADYRLAREGDEVDLRAWYLPMQKGRAVAQRITITSSKPLSSTEGKKPSRPQRRTRTNATPDPAAPDESAGRDSLTDDDPTVRPPGTQ